MPPEEDIDIRVRLHESAIFNAKTRKSAREVDNLGDKAARAARQFRQLNRAAAGTRVNLGPFSTRLRGMVLLFGAAALATEKYAGSIVSLGEAAASIGGGTAAGGAVGLTALAQGAIVTTMALGDMGEALSGNEEAIKRLQPEAMELFVTLGDLSSELRQASAGSFLPGLTRGVQAAMANQGVILRNTRLTGQALGSIAQEGGEMLGSKEWGRDLATMGETNVDILESLGTGTLHLADAARHLLVEAGPLAKWMANVAEGGAATAENFFEAKRETGELSAFFRRARRDMTLLGQGLGAGSRGIINLFSASDVDGTKTLRNFREIMERFERWSESPMVQRGGIGKALVGEVEDVADDLVVALAEGMARSAPMAAEVFWNAFWKSSAEGKALLGAGLLWKSGAFKMLGRGLGRGVGGAAAGALGGGRGSMKNPMYVVVMNPGGGGVTGGGGKGGKASRAGGRLPWWMKGAGAVGLGLFGAEVLGDVIPGEASMPVGGKTPSGTGSQTPAGRLQARVRKQAQDRIANTGPANPNPLSVGNPMRPIKLENRIDLDGREVHRNQRFIDMQDKRRFGKRR